MQSRSFFDYLLTSIYSLSCLIAGITYAHTHHYLAILIWCMALCTHYTIQADKKYILYGILFFSLGYARLYFFVEQYHQTIAQLTAHPKTIVGIVHTIEHAQHAQYRYAIGMTIHSHLEQGVKKEYRSPWQLQCYSMQKPLCSISDTVELNALKIRTTTHSSFGDFLLKEGIHGTAFLDRGACSILEHPPYCLNSLYTSDKVSRFNRYTQKMLLYHNDTSFINFSRQ